LIIINIFKLINTQNPGCIFYIPNKIECKSNEVLDLKEEFKAISNTLNEDEKTFDEFYLNASIDEIPENVFSDIKFTSIYITASNFTKIHSNAFNGTSDQIKYFIDWSHDSKLRDSPPDYDIYEAFGSLVNVIHLDIRLETEIFHKIPEHAFDKSNQLNYLDTIIYGPPKEVVLLAFSH